MSEKQITLSNIATWAEGELIGADEPIANWAIDSRKVLPGDLFMAICGARVDGHDYIGAAVTQGAKALLISKPIATDLPCVLVDDTVKALGRVARAWRGKFDIPVIAVTGSVGKTSTKSLIASIVSEHHRTLATPGNFNSEIGLPLSLLKLNDEHRSAVFEMGAGKQGDIAYLCEIAKPSIALITCAAGAHVSTFGSLDNIARTKAEIYEGLSADGIAIINHDDHYAECWKVIAKDKQILTFALQHPADVYATHIVDNGVMGSSFTLHLPDGEVAVTLPFPGRHNILNALAASAAAFAAKLPHDAIVAGLAKAKNVHGRLQLKQLGPDLQVLDDSYNANPTSMRAAVDVLANLPGETLLVTGDMLELGENEKQDHYDLGVYAKQKGLKRLYSYGPLSLETVKGFGQGALHFDSHEVLAEKIFNDLPKHATLLVKGSRSMRMEKVIENLSAHFALHEE